MYRVPLIRTITDSVTAIIMLLNLSYVREKGNWIPQF